MRTSRRRQAASTSRSIPLNGTVTVLDQGTVRIHSYMSPADTFHTTTQLIETPARIIAIDAQLIPSYADEAVA